MLIMGSGLSYSGVRSLSPGFWRPVIPFLQILYTLQFVSLIAFVVWVSFRRLVITLPTYSLFVFLIPLCIGFPFPLNLIAMAYLVFVIFRIHDRYFVLGAQKAEILKHLGTYNIKIPNKDEQIEYALPDNKIRLQFGKKDRDSITSLYIKNTGKYSDTLLLLKKLREMPKNDSIHYLLLVGGLAVCNIAALIWSY
jgi:hypothetical protein